jgi:HEAT repeat protein
MALDRNQLKMQGLRYAKSLQMVMKTVIMFSADHKGAAQPIDNSYQMLNALLKQTRTFTLGFVDGRIMINNVLTQADRGLLSLENELLKRGIGAVTFEAGITLAAYKRAAGVLAVPTKHLEEIGGLLPWLDQNPIEFLRVYPAAKNQSRTADGDTVLETDSESFLMSKAMQELQSGPDPMDMLFQTAFGERLMQSASTGIETGQMPAYTGSGPGDEAGGGYSPSTGDGSGPSGRGSGGPGEGGPGVHGGSPGAGSYGTGGHGSGEGGSVVGGAPGGFVGNSGAGFGPGPGPGAGPGTGGGFDAPPRPYTDGPEKILSIVDSRLNEVTEAPAPKAHNELARILRDLRPDAVLAALPPARQEELRAMPREQMAVELFEDTTLKWAVNRLTNAALGPKSVVVEGEVIGVLLKALQATQSSVRLGRKLADMAQESLIPKQSYERIQEELKWITLTHKQKLESLLKVDHYNPHQFRRMLDLMKELIKGNKAEQANQLANHYFDIFNDPEHIGPDELSRIPDLFKVASGIHAEFWNRAAEVLSAHLLREKVESFEHFQVINALTALTRIVGAYEDFDLIFAAGAAIDTCASRDPQLHAKCCLEALPTLMNPSAVDRIIEIFVAKTDNTPWMKTAASLLRWAGAPGINKVFHRLEHEQNTQVRLALMRLLGRIGQAALEAAKVMLLHPQWYVVRNAVKLLGEVRDPDLLKDVSPALRHPDERVQKTAIKVLQDARVPGRAAALANALPYMKVHTAEEMLNDLRYAKDPSAVEGLGLFIFHDSRTPVKLLLQAIGTIGVFSTDEAAQTLAHVVSDTELDLAVRRAALQTLTKNLTEAGRRGLKQYASDAASHDPLSTEVLRALSNSQPAPAPKKSAAAAGAPAPAAEAEELQSLEPDELPPIEPTS